MRSLFVACLVPLLLGMMGSCAGGNRRGRSPQAVHPTCEALCERYQYCGGAKDEDRENRCVSECRTIFSEDGKFDESALRQLQVLECNELLSFIDGPL